MAMKPNLDQGNTAAKRKNVPAPLAKSKANNLAKTKPAAGSKGSDDSRIHGDIMRASHPTSHSRKGR